ncbi:MAG TPA: RNA methyltransferase [Methanomassiliicoccales archaeon]|nr:RNA methyltransferase [Methanomassiliicoccales archaeon]
MPSVRIVLVEPRNEGNVGAVARAMGNFGFEDLRFVRPCPIGEEAFKRAKHSRELVQNAKVVETLDEAVRGCSLIVGTSGIITTGEKNYVRIPITPRQLAERLKDFDEQVAILFGPEDTGLSQEDLMRCDILVHIPASEAYPVLNLSHAAAIVLYEIHAAEVPLTGPRPASEEDKEKLFQFFDDLLDAVDYHDFRREKTSVMFRRMIGRAVLTKWEFHTIMGVIGDAVKKIKKLEK